MATLREIRARIQSAGNIKQITKAMEMVAATRLRRVQIKTELARPYLSTMERLLSNLATSGECKHPLLVPRPVKQTGVVVISSDKGLCGAYNSNIMSAADKFLKNYHQEAVELILMGRKAISHYRQRPWTVRHQVKEDGESQNVHRMKALTHQLSDWFLEGVFDEVWIVYTRFINVMSREVVVEKFLNIAELPQDKKASDYLYEPSADIIYGELLPHYLVAKLLIACDEAYASELSARVISMRTAEKNADEMIGRLTLERNKLRQANITNEMLEIINGAEGLK